MVPVLVRSDLKTGRRNNRTPWQIALDAAETGDCRDMARWVEYCQATKGKPVVTGLDAIREHYPTPEPEVTDEDAVNEDQDGTVAACIDARVWRLARKQRKRAVIAEALTAYERDGIEGMLRVFSSIQPGLRAVANKTVIPDESLYAEPSEQRRVPLIEFINSAGHQFVEKLRRSL